MLTPPRLATPALAALTKRVGRTVATVSAAALAIMLVQKAIFHAMPPSSGLAHFEAIHRLVLVLAPTALLLGGFFFLAGHGMATGRPYGEWLARAIAVLALPWSAAYAKATLEVLPAMPAFALAGPALSRLLPLLLAGGGAVFLLGAPGVYLYMLGHRAPEPTSTASDLPYRAPMPPGPARPPVDYAAAWRDYRWRRASIFIIWLTYLPGAGGAVMLGKRLFGSEKPGMAVALLWMAAFAASGIRASLFRCPGCGEKFTSRPAFVGRKSNPFTGKCLNCGLRVGAER